jgi:hypothetical protein
MLEDLYVRRDELKDQLAEASGLERIRLLDTLEAVEKALADPRQAIDTGPVITGDPLADRWEQELAQGRMPDLTEGLPSAAKKKFER